MLLVCAYYSLGHFMSKMDVWPTRAQNPPAAWLALAASAFASTTLRLGSGVWAGEGVRGRGVGVGWLGWGGVGVGWGGGWLGLVGVGWGWLGLVGVWGGFGGVV